MKYVPLEKRINFLEADARSFHDGEMLEICQRARDHDELVAALRNVLKHCELSGVSNIYERVGSTPLGDALAHARAVLAKKS